MKHGSLFSGIGGFDLAAEWMGWENVFHCEWNPFGQKVLKHYWPNSISYNDITKTDFTIHRGTIDIITGGFPCQPYSSAGKRLGKDDERHLWPEMLRAIREIQPRWIVGENVRGLTNWNAGMVFDEVQTDLEAISYEVLPFLLPACAVNAPHRRDRIWFVAYSDTTRRKEWRQSDGWEDSAQIKSGMDNRIKRYGNNGNATNASNERRQQCGISGQISKEERISNGERSKLGISFETMGNESKSNWQNFPTVSPIRMRNDGVSDKLLRFVVKQFYDTISYTSQENRIQNLQEVWERVQSKEIWEQIRGLYSLESKIVLFQTMQLYSSEWSKQGQLSPFSEEFCKPILQHLSKYKEFRCSPQGQELEKQRHDKFGNTLSFLPHEVALAARRFEAAIEKFEAWHRNESIKAGGNAVVPQLVYQIFKAIHTFETQNLKP